LGGDKIGVANKNHWERKVTNEKEIKLETRLMAIEYFLADNLRMTYELLGASAEAVKKSQDNMRERLLKMNMPNADPAYPEI
jgi:hypothetical protein